MVPNESILEQMIAAGTVAAVGVEPDIPISGLALQAEIDEAMRTAVGRMIAESWTRYKDEDLAWVAGGPVPERYIGWDYEIPMDTAVC